MIAPVAAGLGSALVCQRAQRGPCALIGIGVVGWLVAPLPAAAVTLLVFAVIRFRAAAARTRAESAVAEACLEASELVALGLAGGLSVAAAHRVALRHAAGPARQALTSLVSAMQDRGTVPALLGDDGPTGATSRVIASAAASGAPALPALEAHLEAEAHRRHSRRVEAARRLPIRLMLPLTLLVLPGFVLMTVGPTVIDSLARLNP